MGVNKSRSYEENVGDRMIGILFLCLIAIGSAQDESSRQLVPGTLPIAPAVQAADIWDDWSQILMFLDDDYWPTNLSKNVTRNITA
jgi:hypothetical protein